MKNLSLKKWRINTRPSGREKISCPLRTCPQTARFGWYSSDICWTSSNQKTAVTLTELMVATAVFILAFTGILLSYIRCLEFNELSKSSVIAIQASRNRLEEMRNTAFNQIKTAYNNVTFTTAGLNGKGVTYVNDINPQLLKITVTFCWKQGTGRTIGEDTNLNGQLDAGEDKNGNSILDSPTTLVTNIYER